MSSMSFASVFGHAPRVRTSAPGRVNLIGEHTDYNDGWVLPMAIDREVLIAARRRQDTRVYMVALDRRNATSEFAPDSIPRDNQNTWSNYIRGVASLLALHNLRFPGLDMMIAGNVPIGSGLSSSAALLVAAAVTFQTFGGGDAETQTRRAAHRRAGSAVSACGTPPPGRSRS